MVFLQQTLKMKDFSQVWCHWIDQTMRGGSVNIRVNDEVGLFFSKPRMEQDWEIPCLCILFNLVADMIATLIFRAKTNGQINEGSCPTFG